MSIWSRHPSDSRLAALAEGRLSGRARQRVVDHASVCPRCAERHEHLVHVERTLAGGDPHVPSAAELEALRRANRAAVLASARVPASTVAGATGSRWRWVGPVAAAAGVLLIGGWSLLGMEPVQSPEPGSSDAPAFAARGAEREVPDGVLRVFCLEDDGVPRGLDEGDGCPVGATLAFSARYRTVPRVLRLEVLGGPAPEVHVLDIVLAAGREAVLPFTLKLEAPGAREVALHGGAQTLRQRVQVGPAP